MKSTGRCIKYQDVQSLYPTVQFYKQMPVGKPTIFKWGDGDQQPLAEEVMGWFGFVECDLEVERYLHHPVVVAKNVETGKLQADLLPKQKIVLTTPELQCALSNGYHLVRVWEYHQYSYSTDLFKDYIRSYLKIKIHCSGMPAHIKTDQDWEEFAKYHKTKLGIELNRREMVKNAGKKQLAKMMLNSLWGKFAETGGYAVHETLKTCDEYQAMEDRWDMGFIDVNFRMQCLNGDTIVNYREIDDPEQEFNHLSRTNVALSSFVTAWGALTLWEQMDLLGSRVLYHDTDSIVYEYDPAKYNIPVGKYLGEWEDETPGKPIVQFVSTGPKTYAFGVLQEPEPVSDEAMEECLKNGDEFWLNGDTMRRLKYKCKSKGFSQNYFNQSRVNFQQLHRLLLGDIDTIKTCSLRFDWNRVSGTMKTRMEEKILTMTYDKGEIDPSDFTVYPFGYEKFFMEPIHSSQN